MTPTTTTGPTPICTTAARATAPFRIRTVVVALVLALGAALPLAGAVAAPGPDARALDPGLEIASGRFAGVLAVARAGESPQHRSHLLSTDAAGWSTAYPLASVTKVFTATAVLALHEQGRLDLDARLDRLLPGFAGLPAAQVTVRQLLGHTSGVPSVMQSGHGLDATLDPASFPLPSTLQEQLAPVLAMPLGFAPGTRYEYSNSGYLLLGQVIEQVTGSPYDAAIRDLVLAPAGVAERACFCLDLPGHPDAVPQEWREDGLHDATRVHPTRSLTAGGMTMTPEALMTWLQALTDGRILKPDTLAMAWSSGQPTRRQGERMGLGWQVREHDGRRIALHDGALPGATATVAIDLETRAIAIGLLSPTLPLDRLSLSEDYVRERVVALTRGERPDDLPAGPGVPHPDLAGDYGLPDGRTLRLRADDEAWRVELAGGGSPLEARQAVRLTSAFAESAALAGNALVRDGQEALMPFVSDSLKAQLPPQALDGFVADWTARFGPFLGAHVFGTDATDTSAYLRVRFERGAVDVGLHYVDGRIDGLQLLGESRGTLPARLDGWITAEGALWLDGYRHAAGTVQLFPVVTAGRVVGLSIDRDPARHAVLRRLPER